MRSFTSHFFLEFYICLLYTKFLHKPALAMFILKYLILKSR